MWRTEQLFKAGRKDAYTAALAEIGDPVLRCRDTRPEIYCFYQYLELLNEPSSEEKKAALARYIRKLLNENRKTDGWLLNLLVKTDRTCLQNPLELYEQMRSMFGYGCRSPFLYGLACRLLKMHPDLFVKMGEFEIQVFLGGLKNGWLDQNLAVKAALSLSEVKHYRKILERLLVNLYRSYPEMQVLEALCGLLIRGEKKDRSAFGWYEKALKSPYQSYKAL